MGEVLMTAKRRRRDLSEETASCNGKLQYCRASVQLSPDGLVSKTSSIAGSHESEVALWHDPVGFGLAVGDLRGDRHCEKVQLR